MRPVEGTILTVVREAAEAAEAAVGRRHDRRWSRCSRPPGPRRPTRWRARPSCCRCWPRPAWSTPAAPGFLLLLDAAPPRGRRPAAAGAERSARAAVALRRPAASSTTARRTATATSSDLRYEVMYFLEAPDETIPAFKDVWAGIGDSIVVVGGDGIWNCHIHTDDIGAAIEAAIDAGRPRQIRVTDLLEQVEEERWVREATASDIVEVPPARHRAGRAPRWWPSPPATASSASSTASACRGSSPAASR